MRERVCVQVCQSSSVFKIHCKLSLLDKFGLENCGPVLEEVLMLRPERS